MFKELLLILLLSKLIGKKRAKKVSNSIDKYSTKVAAIILFIAAIVHTLRFPLKYSINLGDFTVPYWASITIVLITSYLSITLWKIKR